MMMCPGKLPPQRKYGQVGPDEGDREQDRVADAQAGARHQVVGERVADEPVEDGQDQQRDADGPVQLPGLAEGPGEEDAGHVDDDRADEDVGRPVVHLAHQQAATHGEREVHRGGVGLGHPHAVQGLVDAVVDHHGLGGHEVQGQEDAGGQQDHEGVQGDLAEHERPVVREDLVQEGPAALGHAQAVVELVDSRLDPAVGAGLLGLAPGPGLGRARCLAVLLGCACAGPVARPHRLVEPGPGSEVPLPVDVEGQLGQRAGRRAELRDGAVPDVEHRLVARADQQLQLLLVEAHRAAEVGAHLGVGDVARRAPSLPGPSW